MTSSVPLWIDVLLFGTVFLRTVVVGLGIWFFAIRKGVSVKSAVIAIAIVTSWMVIITISGAAGLLEITRETRPPPRIALVVAAPFLTIMLAYFTWGSFRSALLATPLEWLLGIHIYRVSIGSFLYLWYLDKLPAVFAFPVGIGDIVMGVSGLGLAFAVHCKLSWSRRAIKVWCIGGILELLAFIPLGILTTPSRMQLLAFDQPNLLTTIWPVVLAPTCFVPFALLLHVVTLDKLRVSRAAGPRDEPPISVKWGFVAVASSIVCVYALGAYVALPSATGRPIAFHIHPSIAAVLQSQPSIAVTHIVSGACALALGPWQLLAALRRSRPELHRATGTLYTVAVVISGLAGLSLALRSFAGISAQLGFSALSVTWLLTLAVAVQRILRGRKAEHRRWMLRNFALTLAGVTLRFYNVAGFQLGYELPDFHWLNAWICWIPNLVMAEIYLARFRRKRTVAVEAGLAASSGKRDSATTAM